MTHREVGNPSRYGYSYCILECVHDDSKDYLGEGAGEGHREGDKEARFVHVYYSLEGCNLLETFGQYLINWNLLQFVLHDPLAEAVSEAGLND